MTTGPSIVIYRDGPADSVRVLTRSDVGTMQHVCDEHGDPISLVDRRERPRFGSAAEWMEHFKHVNEVFADMDEPPFAKAAVQDGIYDFSPDCQDFSPHPHQHMVDALLYGFGVVRDGKPVDRRTFYRVWR